MILGAYFDKILPNFDFVTLDTADASGTTPTDSNVLVSVFAMYSELVCAPARHYAVGNWLFHENLHSRQPHSYGKCVFAWC